MEFRILSFAVPLYNHLEPVRMTDKNNKPIDWFLEKVCSVSTKQKLNKCFFVFFFLGPYYVSFTEKHVPQWCVSAL